MYYRSPYIQKGFGIGGIFRNIAKFFRPVARNVVKMVNKPAVRKVLRTVGKEALNSGSELLLDSLQGNTEKSKLQEKISQAKKRIVKSIENAKNSGAKKKGYHILNETDDDDVEEEDFYTRLEHFPRNSSSHMKNRSSLRHASGKRRKPRIANTKKKRKYVKTVFD